MLARNHYGQGGKKRIQYSVPPLLFGSIALAERVYKREENKNDSKIYLIVYVIYFIYYEINILFIFIYFYLFCLFFFSINTTKD